MSKKIALVTGANKGIGFETAKQLAEQGIFVILGARDKEKGEKAVAKLTSLGLEVEYLALDMTDMNSIEGARDYISSKYGVLDILVNNAGVMTNDNGKDFLDVKITDIKIAFETNFFGVISLTQALLPLLKKSASARIVNLSSVLGSLSKMSQSYDWNCLGYNSSKTALNAFTVYLANELKDTKIKVNSCHPGWVKTDMGGEIAPMQIPDGAKTSVWLATLDENGPNGGYFHMKEKLEW